jgi:hypothetical protein
MTDFILHATKNTPEIHADFASRTLSIRGEAYPENAAQFYAPLFTWLEDYLAQPGQLVTTVTIELVYFNSSSSRVLLDLFNRLERAAAQGHQVVVRWRCHQENDMIIEYGEEFAEEVKAIDFQIETFAA